MKSVELWSEKISKPADPNSTMSNQVLSCTFLLDGQVLIAVVADAILVYDGGTGDMQSKPIRGAHKDTITCIASSKDSRRFATGSLDRTVVIWKYNPTANPKIVAELKYNHTESVYCIGFNPLTHQIFSGSANDYAIWTPDVANIEKQKYKEKIISCAWSADGQSLAFGTLNGTLAFTDRKAVELIEVVRPGPIWCMEWTPLTPDQQESILAIGCWNQTISFWNSQAQQLGSDKVLPFDPLTINFFQNGEFYAISGNNNKVGLWTRDGGFLIEVCEANDWIWCCKFRAGQMMLACTTNDGDIFVRQLTSYAVNSLYQERFVTRHQLTDIMITNMLTNQKMRLRCKELVRKVSAFKDKIAVLLGERVLIYVSVVLEEGSNMKYKLYKKFVKKLECDHLSLCAANVLVATGFKLISFTFTGEVDRQWTFESSVSTIVSCGGPIKKDLVLVGLNNGEVFKVFLDNSFPVSVCKQQVPIRRIDISMTKRKLAVVDDNKNLSVIDLTTKEVIFSEMGVEGVAFNCDFEDLIAYSGNGLLFVKCATFPPLNQKILGNIIGFKGCKMFLLNDQQLQTIDIQMTTNMQKFIEKKDFDNAYRIANLGATDQDLKILGVEALQSGDFLLARKCFTRLKDIPLIELVNKYDGKKLDPQQEAFLVAEALAYQGKFQEAGNWLLKSSMPDKAVELFSELKRWDDAKAFAKKGDIAYRAPTGASRGGTSYGRQVQPVSPATDLPPQQPKVQMNKILKEQAEWTKETGDWKTAGDLFVTCGEYRKAIELYGNNKNVEGLVDVCRLIDKSDNADNIQLCAQYFRKLKHHGGAKEAYLKLNDLKSLMQLNVEFEQWEQAFAIGRSNPDLLEIAKLPYAEYLLKNDRYEEALRAFKGAGRYDLTTKMMKEMSSNCVEERRFEDSAHYFWQMASDALALVENYAKPSANDIQHIHTYKEYQDIAEVYFAYQKIHNFIEEPFQPLSGDAYLHQILNTARFIISKQNKSLYGVNMSYVYYALGKVSKNLESYKTARLCYDKLAQYKVPPEWAEEIDLSNLQVRSKPFSDNDLLMPICNRCMTQNSIIGSGEHCGACHHPIISSFLSFNVLPLVEFKIDASLTPRQVQEILNRDKLEQPKAKGSNAKAKKDDGWNDNPNQQVLRLNDAQSDQSTPFFDKLNEIIEMQHTQADYIPLFLDEQVLQTLQPEEVYMVNLQHICPTMEVKYFKNMVPEIPLHGCRTCGKFFLLDEYEFEYLKAKHCPFCKVDDKGQTQIKDIFEM